MFIFLTLQIYYSTEKIELKKNIFRNIKYTIVITKIIFNCSNKYIKFHIVHIVKGNNNFTSILMIIKQSNLLKKIIKNINLRSYVNITILLYSNY